MADTGEQNQMTTEPRYALMHPGMARTGGGFVREVFARDHAGLARYGSRGEALLFTAQELAEFMFDRGRQRVATKSVGVHDLVPVRVKETTETRHVRVREFYIPGEGVHTDEQAC